MKKEQPRREARFKDEIQALRAWYFYAPASMWLRSSMGRMLDRAEMTTRPRGSGKSTLCYCGRTRSEHHREAEFEGECTRFRPAPTMHVASTAKPTGAKPREPDVDISLKWIGRALDSVTEKVEFQREEIINDERFGEMRTGKTLSATVDARQLLIEAHVSMGQIDRRPASELAIDVRVNGKPGPAWCRRIPSGEQYRWPAVLAARHGSVDPIGDSRRFESAVNRARRTLRRVLNEITLDSGARYLVAPMSSAEIRDEALRETPRREFVTVVCCRGARVVDGVLQACETIDSSGPADAHPSAAWPRCTACERPIDFSAKRTPEKAA